jgi:acetate---CoA ligase (ADP-forming)
LTGIAVIGASDKTPWAYWLMRNLREYNYPGQIWPVNPNQAAVFDWPCLASIDDLPAMPEIAALMVRADLAVDAAQELLARGTRRLLTVSAGFRETGTAAGAALEDRLLAACAEVGAELYGPNCVGYASFPDDLCAIAEPVPLGVQSGPVSLVSQSGALMSAAMSALAALGLGLDQCYSIGNGAAFGLSAALRAVSRRPSTSVVCCVLEGIADPEDFAQVIQEGNAAGVRYVFFRLGRSEQGRGIAQSHTGAVVGADAMIAAWLRSQGVLLADSLDELAVLAALASRPATRGGGVFMQSGSGGGAGFAADLAERHGLALAKVSAATGAELADCLPANALISNPLDMVGGSPVSRQRIYQTVHDDPAVAVVLEPYTVAWPDDGEGRRFHRAGMDQLASAARPGMLTVIASIFHQLPTEWVAEYARRTDVLVLPDLDNAIRALAKLYPADPDRPITEPAVARAAAAGIVAEAAGRDVLEKIGVPLVRGVEVVGADAAVQAAAALPGPYVIKISLPDVGHKQRVDGVRVGLTDGAAVAAACREVEESAIKLGVLAAPPASFLVQQMAVGPEILVGLLRDAAAGPVLSVGAGGWAAELGEPAIMVALPAAPDALSRAVSRSRLARALGAERSRELSELVAVLAAEFVNGELAEYTTVECNPVILTATGPVVADVLLVGPPQ